MKRSIIPAAACCMIALLSFFSLLRIDVHAAPYGDGITIHKKNAALTDLMNLIEKKSGYTFWYRKDIATKAKRITIDVKDAPISEVLNFCSKGQLFTFTILGQIIVLKPDTTLYKIPAPDPVLPSAAAKGKTVNDGYQQIDKNSSTTSITKVDGNQLNQTSTANILSNVSINGLQTQTDSRGNINMLIQGRNSIAGGTEPLILLDNVPYQGNINQINPANIESINVLKDPGSTSMYGSRGANGVIVITTKKHQSPAIDPLESLITTREGIDHYEGAHMYAIFRHIAKRYNIEVTYKTSIPIGFYYGKLPVASSLEQLLEILTTSGITYHIEKEKEGKGGTDTIVVH